MLLNLPKSAITQTGSLQKAYTTDIMKSVPSSASGVHKDLPPDGEWRTVRGHHIYIVDGQIVAGSIPGVTKPYKKMDKQTMTKHQHRLDAYTGGKKPSEAKGAPKAEEPKEFHKFDMSSYKHVPAEGAEKVDLQNTHGYTFFAHKDEETGKHGIYEASTGHSFAFGSSATEAKMKAQHKLDKFGADGVKKVIDADHEVGQTVPGWNKDGSYGQKASEVPAPKKAPAKAPKEKQPCAMKTAFHTHTADGYKPAKDAVKVNIDPALSTFVASHKNGGYSVFEGKSGKIISKAIGASTPEEAIKAAKENVAKYGVDKVNELVNSHINQHGISPKYSPAKDGSVYDHTKDTSEYSAENGLPKPKTTKKAEPKKATPAHTPTADQDNDTEYDDSRNARKGQADRDQFIYADEEIEDDYNIKAYHGTSVPAKDGIIKHGFKLSGLSDDLGNCAYFKSPKFDKGDKDIGGRDTKTIVNRFGSGAVLQCSIPKEHFLDCTKGRPKDLEKLMKSVSPKMFYEKRFMNAVGWHTGKTYDRFNEAVEDFKKLPKKHQWGRPEHLKDQDWQKIASSTTAYEVYCRKKGHKAIVDQLSAYGDEGWQIGVYDPTIIKIHNIGKRMDYHPENQRVIMQKALLKALKRMLSFNPYCLVHSEVGGDGHLKMHVLTHTEGGKSKSKLQKAVQNKLSSNKQEVRFNIKQEQDAIEDYQELLNHLKAKGANDRVMAVVKEIMDDEEDHEHNLQCLLRYIDGDETAFDELRKSLTKAKAIHKDLPKGGKWVTVEHHHVYVKDGRVLAGSIPSADGKYKKAGKGVLARHQTSITEAKAQEPKTLDKTPKNKAPKSEKPSKPASNVRYSLTDSSYVKLQELAKTEIPFPVSIRRATQKTMSAGGGSFHILPKKRTKGAEPTSGQYAWTPEEFKHIRAFVNKHKLSFSHSADTLHAPSMYGDHDIGYGTFKSGVWFLYHTEDPKANKQYTEAPVKKANEKPVRMTDDTKKVVDSFSSILGSLGFGKMAKDILKETKRERIELYARVIANNVPSEMRPKMINTLTRLGFLQNRFQKSFETYHPNYSRNAYNVDFVRHDPDHVVYIPVNRLHFPYQTEQATDFDKVYENLKKMKSGEHLDPIIIGYDYDVHDGHHRVEASRVMQYTHMPCKVGGSDALQVQRAREAYQEIWKSFVVEGVGKDEAVLLKSMNACYDMHRKAWTITVDFASEAFRTLANLTKKSKVVLKEL